MLQHFKLIGLAGLAALTLSGCGGHVALKIDHTPPQQPTGALASIAPTAIKVLDFSDQRPGMEPLLLGKRYDSNQVPKGEVTVQRPVSEIVTEAVRAELAAAGHRVVADGEEVVVSGIIKDFSVNTPSVSTLGWDVVAQVGLVVELKSAASGANLVTGTYVTKATARTYINPDDKLIKATFERALGEAMKMIRSDDAIARHLSSRS
jgi:hypothetical protein